MGISDRFVRLAGAGPRVRRVGPVDGAGQVGGVGGAHQVGGPHQVGGANRPNGANGANAANAVGRPGRASRVGIDRGTLIIAAVAVSVAGGLGAIGLAAGGSALAAGGPGGGAGLVGPAAAEPTVTTTATIAPDGYQYDQLGSDKDPTFNELNGINNNGRIAGFYGSGAKGHPGRGYTIRQPWAQADIHAENFPHAAQTEVMGLNDDNVQVGYYSTQNNASPASDNSFGWYYKGTFHKVAYPTGNNHKPARDELDGVNDHDIAVGFYENSGGRYRGYTYNIKTGKFALVTKPGAPTGGRAPSLRALGINNNGAVVGSYTATDGITQGFLKLASGAFRTLSVPDAQETIALGVNNAGTVVGTYGVEAGGTIAFEGFVWHAGSGFHTMVDDPSAFGETVITGINNKGDIVGWYTDNLSRYNGFLAFPAS